MKCILVLNIRHGGGSRVTGILKTIQEHNPCSVVLTEFRRNRNAEVIEGVLAKDGYQCVSPKSLSPRKNSVVIFSKMAMKPQAIKCEVLKQRVVSIEVGDISLIGVYFPAVGQQILRFFPYFKKYLAPFSGKPTIVVGDFNSGINGADNESGVFSASREMSSLSDGYFIDAWRFKNGATKEYSWYSSVGKGFRIDHCFVTAGIKDRISDIKYLHTIRKKNISDHSGLLITLT